MIKTFEDMREHIGHKISCVGYGATQGPVSTAIECETCGIVLIDLSPGHTVGVDDNDGNSISMTWTVTDVMDRADERGIQLTDEQCVDILADINRYKDADIGINWEVIDTYTDMYLVEESK